MRRMEEGLESQKGGTQRVGDNTREKKDHRKSGQKHYYITELFIIISAPLVPYFKDCLKLSLVFLCKTLDERNSFACKTKLNIYKMAHFISLRTRTVGVY